MRCGRCGSGWRGMRSGQGGRDGGLPQRAAMRLRARVAEAGVSSIDRIAALAWTEDVWLTGQISRDTCRVQAYLRPTGCLDQDCSRWPLVWIGLREIAARLDLWPTPAERAA